MMGAHGTDTGRSQNSGKIDRNSGKFKEICFFPKKLSGIFRDLLEFSRISKDFLKFSGIF